MSAHHALARLQKALAAATPEGVRKAITQSFAPSAIIHMCHPFGDIAGPNAFDTLYAPLLESMPDLERRYMIALNGSTVEG